jgi:hypothetical protein
MSVSAAARTSDQGGGKWHQPQTDTGWGCVRTLVLPWQEFAAVFLGLSCVRVHGCPRPPSLIPVFSSVGSRPREQHGAAQEVAASFLCFMRCAQELVMGLWTRGISGAWVAGLILPCLVRQCHYVLLCLLAAGALPLLSSTCQCEGHLHSSPG